MSIYDDFDHFKEISGVRFWAHNFYLKAYSGNREYVSVSFQKNQPPRLFNLIKRK